MVALVAFSHFGCRIRGAARTGRKGLAWRAPILILLPALLLIVMTRDVQDP